MRIACVALAVLTGLIAGPAIVLAEGAPEDMVTEGEVLRLIRANQVNVVETLDQTCGTCHGGDTEYPVAGAVLGYENSGHALGFDKHAQNSYYANGNGCQQCHTSEGFVEYVTYGELVSEYIDYPSQPGCFSCHDPHVTGDFSLRTVKPVTLQEGSVFDVGSGNLCANCHQARSAASNIITAMPANRLRSYWGAHHGPEADVYLGVNAGEIPGKSYRSSAHTFAIEDGCVSCHLALPEGRYSLSPQVGGHSFYLKGEVHGETKVNTVACTSCHTDMGQDGEFFGIATQDYDNDGSVEAFQMEVEGLFERFVNSEGTGVLQTASIPVYGKDGSFIGSRLSDELSDRYVRAVYNYRFFEEDRSYGVHNPVYTIQVLYDTLQTLDPGFNTSKRPN